MGGIITLKSLKYATTKHLQLQRSHDGPAGGRLSRSCGLNAQQMALSRRRACVFKNGPRRKVSAEKLR